MCLICLYSYCVSLLSYNYAVYGLLSEVNMDDDDDETMNLTCDLFAIAKFLVIRDDVSLSCCSNDHDCGSWTW